MQTSALIPLFKKEPSQRERAAQLAAEIKFLRAEYTRASKEQTDYRIDHKEDLDEMHLATLRIAEKDALDMLVEKQMRLDEIVRGLQ